MGYILSEDPTYITNHRQARTLIRKLDRDELLQTLVRSYLCLLYTSDAPRAIANIAEKQAHEKRVADLHRRSVDESKEYRLQYNCDPCV